LNTAIQCDDGVDNADADTLVDYPDDLGCSSPTDNNEVNGQCDDISDNDGDTYTDYPSDPGCTSYSDSSELGSVQCDDGIDKGDADTLVDYPDDLGCSSPTDNNEVNGQCDDASDNDADTYTDYPNDPECNSYADSEIDCTDTDGGYNFNTQGTVYGSFGGVPFNVTDYCLDSTYISEYICSIGSPATYNTSCIWNATTQCVNGRCV
jgi:hypothetical protein